MYDLDSQSSSNMTFKTFLFKMLGSIGLSAMLLILLLVMYEEEGFFSLLIVYILYYLAYGIYYIHLIWRKKGVKGEDVLLLPFLNKIGIYKDITDEYNLKRKLLQTVLPILIISILSPILFAVFDYGLSVLAYFLPFIAWVVFFIYAYSSEWLNKSKSNN